MRLSRDLLRRLPTTAAPERAEPVYEVGDVRRPASWSVPIGVRTASEWSWRAIVISAGVYAVFSGLAYLSEVVIPVIVALLLAALLNPVKRLLERGMPEGLAAGATVVGTLALLFGLFSFVGTQLVDQLDNIGAQLGEGITQVRDWVASTFHITDNQITTYLEKAQSELLSGGIGTKLSEAGITAGHVVAGFFMMLFTLFFFLTDGPGIWAWVVRLFPRNVRAKVHSSGLIAWQQVSAFSRATIVVAAVDALGIGLGAAALHVPLAIGIGLIVFFGAFVPVVGALVSGGVAVLLALVALGPIKALIMLGIVVLVMQLEAHILQPILIGRAMSVHPLAVILGIATGVLLAGIVGALIAVPVIAVLNAVGRHLLGGETEVESVDDVLTPAQEVDAEAAARQTLERSAASHEGHPS